jgi:hypothetical protein
MGSSFFKSKPPAITGGGSGPEARALGQSAYAARAGAAGAAKNLGVAAALNKSKFKPQKSSGAYPPGPKA